jgi:type II secretory pathway pseudopilin PulG
MRMTPKRLHEEAGVSLVELLVVILLMTIIGGAATNTLVRSMKVSATTQTRFDALAELQKSVDRMTRELRAAAPLVVGGAPVVVAEPNRIVVNEFRNNFTEQRRFTYQFCPTQQRLHARVEGPAPAPSGSPANIVCASTTVPVLIEDIDNPGPVFEYFDSAGAATTVPAQIKTIRVTVRRALDGQNPITVTTMVRLRNVR